MRTETKRGCDERLKRIEGQVRGIARMIEGDRYCIDVLTQLRAVRAALRQVEAEVLRDQVEHCVALALSTGDQELRDRTVRELLGVMGNREG